jgi:hypothetical protein
MFGKLRFYSQTEPRRQAKPSFSGKTLEIHAGFTRPGKLRLWLIAFIYIFDRRNSTLLRGGLKLVADAGLAAQKCRKPAVSAKIA